MASNDSSYFIEPAIPTMDMTLLEDMVLSHMLTAVKDGDMTSFFVDGHVDTMPELDLSDLRRALEETRAIGTPLFDLVCDQIKAAKGQDDTYVLLNLDLFDWESIFQPIIKRSSTLTHVTVKAVFTCSKMRSSGYGGEVTLITPATITTKSLDGMLSDMIAEHKMSGLIPSGTPLS